MPPISGMQAIAAATFEGKPVDVDFGPGSGPGLGGGAGGIGSSSGMPYIHKTTNVLSSNLAAHARFRFHSGVKRNIVRLNSTDYMTNNRSPAFTLIELLVVIATIIILAAIATPVFNG